MSYGVLIYFGSSLQCRILMVQRLQPGMTVSYLQRLPVFLVYLHRRVALRTVTHARQTPVLRREIFYHLMNRLILPSGFPLRHENTLPTDLCHNPSDQRRAEAFQRVRGA